MNNQKYIDNIKNSFAIRAELQNNEIYKELFYADTKNKICITFTPKSACSAAFQNFLDLVGLLKDGLEVNPFIHIYRCHIFNNYVNTVLDVNQLIKENYFFIKFIQNPYIRAVSSYRHVNYNGSFRNFMKKLINNDLNDFNDNDIFHFNKQYIKDEESYINKYIKIDKNEIFIIELKNTKKFVFYTNKYSSIHYGIKNINNNSFCGDLIKNDIINNLPSSYKYFYDDEIKNMVEIYYKDDIDKYNYKFDFI